MGHQGHEPIRHLFNPTYPRCGQFLFWQGSNCIPQKSNPLNLIYVCGVKHCKAHHQGALHPLEEGNIPGFMKMVS